MNAWLKHQVRHSVTAGIGSDEPILPDKMQSMQSRKQVGVISISKANAIAMEHHGTIGCYSGKWLHVNSKTLDIWTIVAPCDLWLSHLICDLFASRKSQGLRRAAPVPAGRRAVGAILPLSFGSDGGVVELIISDFQGTK